MAPGTNDGFLQSGDTSAVSPPEAPRHGFQGNRLPKETNPIPAGLTITVSREVGSRGTTIARRVARMLGWQIYNQELLEYIAQEGVASQDLLAKLTPAAHTWMNERLDQLLRQQDLSQHPSVLAVARIMLALAAQGEVLLVGRGAGFILPPEASLHVRIIAPLADRVAYMAQWLRLTPGEAAAQVELRDVQRAQFLDTHFHRKATDIYPYHLVLNSSLLGEDLCAVLIAEAARSRWEQRMEESGAITESPA